MCFPGLNINNSTFLNTKYYISKGWRFNDGYCSDNKDVHITYMYTISTVTGLAVHVSATGRSVSFTSGKVDLVT